MKPRTRCHRANRSWPRARSTTGIRAIASTWSSSRSDETRPVSRPREVSAAPVAIVRAVRPPPATHSTTTTVRLAATRADTRSATSRFRRPTDRPAGVGAVRTGAVGRWATVGPWGAVGAVGAVVLPRRWRAGLGVRWERAAHVVRAASAGTDAGRWCHTGPGNDESPSTHELEGPRRSRAADRRSLGARRHRTVRRTRSPTDCSADRAVRRACRPLSVRLLGRRASWHVCLARCLPIARQVASWHAPVSWRTIARPSEPRNPSSVLVNPPAAVVSHRFRRPGVSSGAVPVAGDVMRFLVPRRQPPQGLSGTDFDDFLGPQRSPQAGTRCAPPRPGCPPVGRWSSTGTSTGGHRACPACGHPGVTDGRPRGGDRMAAMTARRDTTQHRSARRRLVPRLVSVGSLISVVALVPARPPRPLPRPAPRRRRTPTARAAGARPSVSWSRPARWSTRWATPTGSPP